MVQLIFYTKRDEYYEITDTMKMNKTIFNEILIESDFFDRFKSKKEEISIKDPEEEETFTEKKDLFDLISSGKKLINFLEDIVSQEIKKWVFSKEGKLKLSKTEIGKYHEKLSSLYVFRHMIQKSKKLVIDSD